jgi:hypothetical protein
MGMNKRYAHYYDDKWRQEQERKFPQPFPASLGREQVDPDNHPIKRAKKPIPVKAWVTLVMPETGVLVDAVACAWNDNAVEIMWRDKFGTERRSWLWASAVERVQPPEGA